MTDAEMTDFLFMKALIARYGVEEAAMAMIFATRLVADGEFTTEREAIKFIEEVVFRVPATTPVSVEVANYTTTPKGQR